MITFYATIDTYSVRSTTNHLMPNVPYLLPASSWAGPWSGRGAIPTPRLPDHLTHLAADCGGFVATRRWGDYRYTLSQYATWLSSFLPKWAAMMDYCCEDEITSGNHGVVRKRQDKTTDNAYKAWHLYKAAPWAWVPTIQGWCVADYVRHARDLKPLIDEMSNYYVTRNPYFRVGIGTLCARASASMIREIVLAVGHELPGMEFHLWGVKMSLFRSFALLPSVTSTDSAAWHGGFGNRTDEWKASGMRRLAYRYTVALPRYLSRIAVAQDSHKQIALL